MLPGDHDLSAGCHGNCPGAIGVVHSFGARVQQGVAPRTKRRVEITRRGVRHCDKACPDRESNESRPQPPLTRPLRRSARQEHAMPRENSPAAVPRYGSDEAGRRRAGILARNERSVHVVDPPGAIVGRQKIASLLPRSQSYCPYPKWGRSGAGPAEPRARVGGGAPWPSPRPTGHAPDAVTNPTSPNTAMDPPRRLRHSAWQRAQPLPSAYRGCPSARVRSARGEGSGRATHRAASRG